MTRLTILLTAGLAAVSLSGCTLLPWTAQQSVDPPKARVYTAPPATRPVMTKPAARTPVTTQQRPRTTGGAGGGPGGSGWG